MRFKVLIPTILLGILGLGPTASVAQVVVIASNTEQFSAGDVVESSREITLPAGTTITLISSDGGTVKLVGPYQGKPSPVPSTSNESLIDTLSEIATKESQYGLAVFRAKPNSATDLWAVNVSRSGTYCVRSDVGVVLQGKQAGGDRVMHIATLADPDDVTSVTWPAGKQVIDWPAATSLIDGTKYFLQFENPDSRRQVKIKLIPTGLPTEAHIAAWMWQNGCDRQARRVVRVLAKGE